MRVELLHHEGCPLADSVRELVTDCLRQAGIEETLIDRIARYPSPSVLVDGVDVMGTPGAGQSADACRLDVPTRDQVLAALAAAAG